MIFLVLSEKMIFLFPEKVILFFRQKMKEDLYQKNTWEYDIFFKCSEKMVFPKKSHWNMIFFMCYLKKCYFFYPSLDGKWKIIFFKKYMEIQYFLYVRINLTNMMLTFCQKIQRRSSPEKMHLKVIDILDWHSKKEFQWFSILLWRPSLAFSYIVFQG